MALNDDIYSQFVMHQFDLERVKASVRNKVWSLLGDVENEISAEIEKRNLGGKPFTDFQRKRFDGLRKEVNQFLSLKYKNVNRVHTGEMNRLAKTQMDFILQNGINEPLGIDLATIRLTSNQLATIASDTLVQGAPSRDWWAKQNRDVQDEFARRMRLGLVQGEANQSLIQRVRGTRANNFKDGLFRIPRHQAEALVRTSSQAVANRTNVDTYVANRDVIKAVEQQSTLDNKTTPVCVAYSGKVWIITEDGGFVPDGHDLPFISEGGSPSGTPRHWSCRSAIIPVVKGFDELADAGYKQSTEGKTEGRPLKGVSSLQKKLRQRIKENNEKLSNAQITNKTQTLQSSMNGQPAGDLDFLEWAKQQPPSVLFDNPNIGRTRAQMLMDGKITAEDLVKSTNGRPLDISELQKRIAAKKAAKTRKAKPKSKPIEPEPTPTPSIPEELQPAFGRPTRDMDLKSFKAKMKKNGVDIDTVNKDTVKVWNEDFGMDLDDFVAGIKKDIPSDMTFEDISITVNNNPFLKQRVHVVDFAARNPKGDFIRVRRNFLIDQNTGEHVVKHSNFHLSPSLQSQGIAKNVLRNWMDLYEQMGVKRISLDANVDVGGYAWSRYGFKPTQKFWDENPIFRKGLRERLDSLVEKGRLDRTSPDFDFLSQKIDSPDPKSIWKIADSKYGKDLLLNTGWTGELDFSDKEAFERFKNYLGWESKKVGSN